MHRLKHCYKYIITFAVTILLLVGMLIFSAMLPRELIKQNVKESAEYLCDGELFGCAYKDVSGSKIDRYADSILLGIAYQYDSDRPVTSVMWSSYYYTEYQNENENLLDAVTNDREANRQYLRYWHGANAVVRPLLVIFNIKQIYIVNGIILSALVIILMTVLIRHKSYTPAAGVLAGLIGTTFWFVPLSLEYTWTFILMLLVSIIGVLLAYRGKYRSIGMLFLAGGVITNFFDFLTTETLTLTVPLLLILWILKEHGICEDIKESIRLTVKSVLAWGIGYVGMWVLKWLTASLILGQNVMPYVSEHIGQRIDGNIGVGTAQYILGAIWKNVRCVFPFEYGTIGTLAGVFLVIFVIYIGYVYHGSDIDGKRIGLYLVIGFIPYIRYVVLHNHSYLHYFFTYRAQLATILAIVLILEQLTNGMCMVNADKKEKKDISLL